jgi:hypothetical protein
MMRLLPFLLLLLLLLLLLPLLLPDLFSLFVPFLLSPWPLLLLSLSLRPIQFSVKK